MRHSLLQPRPARVLRRVPLEAAVWTAALVALACTDPAAEGWLSLCPLDALGVAWCPGCGLGHSIAYLVRAEWALALQAHPLGPVALLALAGRIGALTYNAFRFSPHPS